VDSLGADTGVGGLATLLERPIILISGLWPLHPISC
jgi:hypothetical protein